MLTAWSNRMQVLNPWKLFLLCLSLPTPPLQGWVDSSGLSSRECPKFLLTMFGPGQDHHIFLLKSRCQYFRLPWLCHLSKHHSTLSFCWRTSHRQSIKKWGCCIITKLKLEYWNWNVIWLSGVIKYDPSWDFFFSVIYKWPNFWKSICYWKTGAGLDWNGESVFCDVWSEGCTCDPCKAKSCWERVCASSFSAMMAAVIFVDRWSSLACGRGEWD